MSRINRKAAEWTAKKEWAGNNRLHPLLRVLNNPLTDVVTLPLAATGVGAGVLVGKQALTTAAKAGVKKKARDILKERAIKQLPREVAVGAGGLAGYEAASTFTDNPILQLAAAVAGGGGVAAGTRGLARTAVPSGGDVAKAIVAKGAPPSKGVRSAGELFAGQLPRGSGRGTVPPVGGGTVPPSGGMGARELNKALGAIATDPMLSSSARKARAAELMASNGDAATLKILADATTLSPADLRKMMETATPEELARYATVQDFVSARTGNTDAVRRLEALRDDTISAGNTVLDETVRLGDDTLLSRWGLEGGEVLPEVAGHRVQLALQESADALRRARSAEMSPKYMSVFARAEGTPTMRAAMADLTDLDPNKYIKGKGLSPSQSRVIAGAVEEMQKEGLREGLQGVNSYTRVLHTMAVDAGRQNHTPLAGALKRLRYDAKDMVRKGAPGIERLDQEFSQFTRQAERGKFGELYGRLTKERRGGMGEESLEFATKPDKVVGMIGNASKTEVAKLASTLPTEVRRDLADALLSEAAEKGGAVRRKLVARAGVVDPARAERVAGAVRAMKMDRTAAKATGTEYDKRRNIVDTLGRDIWRIVSDLPGLREVAGSDTVAAIGDAARGVVGGTSGRHIQAFASADPAVMRSMVMRGDIPAEVAVDAMKAQKIAEVAGKMSPYQATSMSKTNTESSSGRR